MDEAAKDALCEYRKTHILKDTAAVFGCSMYQVWKVSKKRGVRIVQSDIYYMNAVFVTWTYKKMRYLAVPNAVGVGVTSKDGKNWGSWKSVKSFRDRQRTGVEPDGGNVRVVLVLSIPDETGRIYELPAPKPTGVK